LSKGNKNIAKIHCYIVKIVLSLRRTITRRIYKKSISPKKWRKLKEGSLLGPYDTSDFPITIVIVALIVIVVPLLSPYCYYCAP